MVTPNPEVHVIDYGLGNILSVQRGLEYCVAKVILTSDPEIILAATHIVLPGVGAFASAMGLLQTLELIPAIREAVQRKSFLLGICLGMQLLLDESEEFVTNAGLGLIPGRVVHLPAQTADGCPQKIPHIGWSALQPLNNSSASWENTILNNIQPGDAVYFVHSLMAVLADTSHEVAACRYGDYTIPAVIKYDNVTGCQFHPEKSGEAGLRILRSFIAQ